MEEKVELLSIFRKMLIFLLLYSGFYLIAVTVRHVLEVLYEFNTLSIIIGIGAIITIIASSITLRALSHYLKYGWHILITITGVSIGIGALISTFTPFGALFVAAGGPGLILLIDPSRVETWSRLVFNVNRDAKLLAFLGMMTGMILLMFDMISLYFCNVTFFFLTFTIIGVGIISLIQVSRSPSISAEDIPVKFGRVSFIERAVAVYDTFVWTLYPILLLFVLRELAVLSTFGSLIPIDIVVYLSMACVGGGIVLSVLIWYVLKLDQKEKLILSLIFLGITGIISILLVQTIIEIESPGTIILRLVLLASLPPATSGIYMRRVPTLKTTFLNFFRTFATIISSLFTMVFLLFFDENLPVVFNILYGCLLGLWIVAYVSGISLERIKPRKEIEVTP